MEFAHIKSGFEALPLRFGKQIFRRREAQLCLSWSSACHEKLLSLLKMSRYELVWGVEHPVRIARRCKKKHPSTRRHVNMHKILITDAQWMNCPVGAYGEVYVRHKASIWEPYACV